SIIPPLLFVVHFFSIAPDGDSFLASIGAQATCSVEWDNINLQDETALAEARLKNAQAREIEMRLEKNES
ncbi:MAG: hypothetical protein ACI4JL_12840, partial [Ruminococcus flavefaciens]